MGDEGRRGGQILHYDPKNAVVKCTVACEAPIATSFRSARHPERSACAAFLCVSHITVHSHEVIMVGVAVVQGSSRCVLAAIASSSPICAPPARRLRVQSSHCPQRHRTCIRQTFARQQPASGRCNLARSLCRQGVDPRWSRQAQGSIDGKPVKLTFVPFAEADTSYRLWLKASEQERTQ